MGALVHHLLSQTAGRDPSRVALVAGGNRRSFAELNADSDTAAAALRSLGVRRGDRVAIMLENSIEYATAFFGALKAGAVYVPINPSTKADKLAYILGDCGVRVLVTATGLARTVPPALADVSAGAPPMDIVWVGPAPPTLIKAGAATLDALLAAPHTTPEEHAGADQDLAAILYTSGTTGRPKGVMLTHANLVSTAGSIAAYLKNTPDDVVLSVLPLAFGYGLSQLTTTALVGFTLILERSFAFPLDTLARMVEHRVTGLPGVPSVFATLLQMEAVKTADLSSLRYLTNAAAPLPVAHIHRLAEQFPQAAFHSMYGATECSTRIASLDPSRLADKPGSVGKAISVCDACVVDANGDRAAPGVVGELAVRGANVMRGYWNQPEATARCLQDGVFLTGDLFRTDDEGFLHFVARKDDVFKCRGEKVSPTEVEGVLCEIEAVAEAAVMGVADAVDGMAIKAFIVLRADSTLTPAAIMRHCRGRLEGHMLPKFIEFRTSLPKTESGKLKRLELATTA